MAIHWFTAPSPPPPLFLHALQGAWACLMEFGDVYGAYKEAMIQLANAPPTPEVQMSHCGMWWAWAGKMVGPGRCCGQERRPLCTASTHAPPLLQSCLPSGCAFVLASDWASSSCKTLKAMPSCSLQPGPAVA